MRGGLSKAAVAVEVGGVQCLQVLDRVRQVEWTAGSGESGFGWQTRLKLGLRGKY